jgi:hypothetical protein
MPSTPLPGIALPAGRWTQIEWFTAGPFPYGITRTYCQNGFSPVTVRWRYYGPGGYLEGNFTGCAQVTIVGIFYITVEMFCDVDTTITVN